LATQRTARGPLFWSQYLDPRWDLVYAASFAGLGGVNAVGGLSVTPAALNADLTPAGLNVRVGAGPYIKADGTAASYAGTASYAVAASTTARLWLDGSGALDSGSAWPGTAHTRLATVVAGTTDLTSVTDERVAAVPTPLAAGGPYLPLSGGTFADATATVVLVTGTTNGVQVAGSASQLLGFHGAAPSARAAGADQAAAGALTTAALTGSTGGTASGALATIADSATADAVASLAAQLANTVTDLTALRTLANRMRSDLVAKGLIKGSA
jgi:hypothetical protein